MPPRPANIGPGIRALRGPITAFLGALAMALLFLPWFAPASALARVSPDIPANGKPTTGTEDSLIRRIQAGLTKAGFYGGPLNGRMTRDTRAAIRAYQRSVGLKIDGRPSGALLSKIETTSQVENLLTRLEQAKQAHIDTARQALLAQPATRELLSTVGKEIADPTRDPSPCFRAPTTQCLLSEATESAKAIHRTDMRDWALGEILAAQARAGMQREAMITVRRIGDPRLIIVALRDIASFLAAAGFAEEALNAAAIIPDDLKRAEALAAIASLQVHHLDSAGARQTALRLTATARRLDDPAKKVAYFARAAVIFDGAGDRLSARANLETAETLARGTARTAKTDTALRHVAAALAEMGQPAKAMAMLDQLNGESDRLPVLVASATAEARTGDPRQALAIAEDIVQGRYRTVVLSRIAVAQVNAGDTKAARMTAEKAIAETEEIERPYARDFGLSRIALALGEIGKAEKQGTSTFNRAGETAAKIKDDVLRAQTLWNIAAMRKRAGDTDGAARTGAAANTATDAIKSALSRVWMFSDLATTYMTAGDSGDAWKAFNSGVQVAKGIHNAWARARALGKLAAVMSGLGREAGKAGKAATK